MEWEPRTLEQVPPLAEEVGREALPAVRREAGVAWRTEDVARREEARTEVEERVDSEEEADRRMSRAKGKSVAR